MKNGIFSFFIGLSLAANLAAQTSTVSSVSVVATDPIATEPGPVPMDFLDTGIFTITRQGPTNMPLVVFFTLSGTASNGVDYFEVEPRATIPEGQRTARVQIAPKHDELVEGEERVILRLLPSNTTAPGYVIGPSNTTTAVVVIRDTPPQDRDTVTIVAVDPDAYEVDLRMNTPVGVDNRALMRVSRTGPTNFALAVFYHVGGTATSGSDYLALSGEALIPEGSRSADIIIAALDDSLVEPTETVEVTVVPPACVAIEPPPPECYLVGTPNKAVAFIHNNDFNTNVPPAVRIVQPEAGAQFKAPADIHIVADTVDLDGYVGMVEFFANGAKIGESIINFIVAPPDGTPISHEFDWKGVGTGQYALTARATDDEGRATMSSPVGISVTESNAVPRTVVSIVATDPEGSEIPEVPPGMERPQLFDPAIFTVSRTGSPSNDLTVYYTVGGTAKNGVDYVEIPTQLKIPAGSRSAQIEIDVLDDLLVEGTENVVIRIVPPICVDIFPPPPECYVVGAMDNVIGAVEAPSVAEARILDNDAAPSNKPPVVSIVVPTNGAVFTAPADIRIIAQAFDSDGYVHTVEFFAGDKSLGVTTNNPLAANVMNPFQITWEDVPPGQYALSALATDNQGAKSRSRTVFISVVGETNRQTVVNIRAIDPEAAEQDPRLDSLPNNALLRVTRSGPTDFDLPVFYRVDGTAINGVDYVELKGELVIPTGSESADIVIQAIDDKLVERTESVVVALVPPICPAIWPPPKECYLVGSANRATAFILDDEPFETNAPPHVEITQPASGATFRAPADVHIVAKTVDRDGYVGKVEFFANFHKIGEASKLFLIPPPDGEPIEYEFDWKGVPPGQYALTARAIDDEGAAGLSAPVRISVVGTNEPPPTNVAVVTVYAIDGYASEGPILSPYTGSGGLGANTNTTVVIYTNRAVFEIRRSGNLSSSLHVFYEMHGTATEGVDYLDVPGIAEIPAGATSARVVITPIDDTLREGLESVVICLRPSPVMSILPTYVVGRPAQAAAVIADNDTLRLACACLDDGVFHWCRPATNDQCYRIDCSSDLKEWTTLTTVRATEGAVSYTDPEGIAYDRRFYRAVPVPCPADQ
jgi:Big-like domain-containing protein/Calx-beta domain-containing protein